MTHKSSRRGALPSIGRVNGQAPSAGLRTPLQENCTPSSATLYSNEVRFKASRGFVTDMPDAICCPQMDQSSQVNDCHQRDLPLRFNPDDEDVDTVGSPIPLKNYSRVVDVRRSNLRSASRIGGKSSLLSSPNQLLQEKDSSKFATPNLDRENPDTAGRTVAADSEITHMPQPEPREVLASLQTTRPGLASVIEDVKPVVTRVDLDGQSQTVRGKRKVFPWSIARKASVTEGVPLD